MVIDPRDTRAFGYIYNTSDDRHQFWAIKTERAAAVTVLALKEVFELAFEEYSKKEKAQADALKPASPTIPTPPAEAPSSPSVRNPLEHESPSRELSAGTRRSTGCDYPSTCGITTRRT